MQNVSLIIHGPCNEEWLKQIIKDIRRAKFEFAEKLIVSYVKDYECYKKRLSELNVENEFRIIVCKDVLNPGFFNINRQIKTVSCALNNLTHQEGIVIKLRNDQTVNFNKLAKYLENLEDEKILTTNCFTRKDRLYHPSDMFMCAKYNTLKEYFSCPPMHETHLGHILSCEQEYKKAPQKMTALKIVPESYLFRNFLKKHAWTIKETKTDSINALKKYIKLVNTWDIDLKWKSKRTPFLPAGSLILPYSVKMRPFAAGPLEECRCINRNELEQNIPSARDCFYVILSTVLFNVAFKNRKYIYKTKYKILKSLKWMLELFPYIVISSLISGLDEKICLNKEKYRNAKRFC